MWQHERPCGVGRLVVSGAARLYGTIAALVWPTVLTARDFRRTGLLYPKVPAWIQKLFR